MSLAVPNFHALPPEEVCIDRPHAGSQKGEANPESPDDEAIPAIVRVLETFPQGGHGQKRAGDRRP